MDGKLNKSQPTDILDFLIGLWQSEISSRVHSCAEVTQMPALRLKDIPLNRPIPTKLSDRDYQALQRQVAKQGINQTALARQALRRYLYTTLEPPAIA